jgi:SAM-dependent methyltransferase
MALPDTVIRSLKAVDRALPWETVLRGDNLECPCCGGTFRKFRSLNGRPNAMCPRCQALERHRVLWLYLRDRTDLFSAPQRLLHFAAEPGFEDRLRALGNLDYASVDLYPKNSFQQRIDITDMPYEDGSWDVVMANHVFGEVPDDRKAMGEVFRVLKPGGRLISQTAVVHGQPETVERAYEGVESKGRVPRGGRQAIGTNIRRYGDDYADRLREAGFSEVMCVAYVDDLDPETVERYALREVGASMTGNDIYVSTKPAS